MDGCSRRGETQESFLRRRAWDTTYCWASHKLQYATQYAGSDCPPFRSSRV